MARRRPGDREPPVDRHAGREFLIVER